MVPQTDEEWPKCVTGEHQISSFFTKNNLDRNKSQVPHFEFPFFLVFKQLFLVFGRRKKIEWRSISGPICEPPPTLPFEGKVTLNVTQREVDKVKTCKVTVA